MGFATFLLVLAAGAALLAAWLLGRFPELSPAHLRLALLHFGISLALVWAVPNAAEPLVREGLVPALTAAFFLVLPPLVYSCLAAAWILRLVHEAITH